MPQRQIYGLVGRVLGHSFSRSYFTEKFEREGIAAEYVNIEVADAGALPAALAARTGLRGFNVTVPYKEAVVPLMTGGLDESAQRVGAVNVVSVLPDGRMRGYNTDAPAFETTARALLAGRPMPARALVLGTGGAAKAVVAALASMGVQPVRVSRSAGRAELTYATLTAADVAACGLVVNATPLGMWPECDEAPPIPYDALTPAHACYDLVYNPDPTLFMRLAAARGAAVCSGLAMLHAQAEGSWAIWCNQS